MDTLRTFEARVEVAGWDEAFLSVETDEPEDLAREMQDRVLERTRLWSTIGSATTGCRPSSRAGSASPRRLHRDLRALARADVRPADHRPLGRRLDGGQARRARDPHRRRPRDRRRGRARRTLRRTPALAREPRTRRGLVAGAPEGWTAKGHGRERTSSATSPITTRSGARPSGWPTRSSTTSGARRSATHVTVKVRFAPFFTSTHGVTLGEPTMEPEALPVRGSARSALRVRPARAPARRRAEMAPPQRPREAQDARGARAVAPRGVQDAG